MKLKITSLLLFIIYLLTTFTPQAKAEITTSDNWTMQINDVFINSNPPPKNQKKQTPQDSSLEANNGINYKGSLSFSISNSLIDYGIISPTNPIFRTSNLSIYSKSLKNFMVFAWQNHPPATDTNAHQIPDSTCDNGSCSQITSALWSNTLTYGFGFRCDNITEKNCPDDMKEDNYYKQFSDSSKKESPQTIMTNNTQNQTNQIQITYKINTSKSQPPDYYSNTITYIAAPGY
jgi:hypothetical protein